VRRRAEIFREHTADSSQQHKQFTTS